MSALAAICAWMALDSYTERQSSDAGSGDVAMDWIVPLAMAAFYAGIALAIRWVAQ